MSHATIKLKDGVDCNVSQGPVRLIWHRRDLRLLDNEMYSHVDRGTSCISLYVVDPSNYLPRPSTCSPSQWDTVRTGPHFARTLIDALSNLRRNLRSLGSDLLIRTGNPVAIVLQIAQQIDATEVRWAEIPGTEETNQSRAVKDALISIGNIAIVTDVTGTLYHPNDLPTATHAWMKARSITSKAVDVCPDKKEVKTDRTPSTRLYSIVDVSPERLKGMCLVMGDYRRAVRAHARVRTPLARPRRLARPQIEVAPGKIPTFWELYRPLQNHLNGPEESGNRKILGLPPEFISSVLLIASERSLSPSGEDAALDRLSRFLSSGRVAEADRSLADVSSNDDSSKLSVYLALGTISPRTIYEAACAAGEGAKWLVSHLEIRDYFLYYTYRVGAGLFRKDGSRRVASYAKKQRKIRKWRDPSEGKALTQEHWTRWAMGRTGFPLVDAAMREVVHTGYCSNRVRQNAVSFLAKDLCLDWRAGAELYQFLLGDFCVAANWGNWAYFSGVGSDPKERHFRTVSQARRYDPTGGYVRKWLPELEGLADDVCATFTPWSCSETSRNWPKPLVDPETQLAWYDRDLASKLSDKPSMKTD